MPAWKLREKGCTPTGQLYLLVDIWFGSDTTIPPDLTNDFVLDIPRYEYPIVKRADGYWLHKDGSYIRPNVAEGMDSGLFQRLETAVNVRQRVADKIKAYIQRAIVRGDRGDKTAAIVRDSTDRRDQLTLVDNEGAT